MRTISAFNLAYIAEVNATCGGILNFLNSTRACQMGEDDRLPHPNKADRAITVRAFWLAMSARYRTAVAGVKGLIFRLA